MLERAREHAAAEGLANATFRVADAQVEPLGVDRFDVVMSKFGVMFFADPVAAFANFARATTPGGRLAFVSWRNLADNEWLQVMRGAAAQGRELPSPPEDAPGMLGLAGRGSRHRGAHGRGVVRSRDGGGRRAVRARADRRGVRVRGRGRGGQGGARRSRGRRPAARPSPTCAPPSLAHEADGEVALGSGIWLVTARR